MNGVNFEDDDPLVRAINGFSNNFAQAYSTSAYGIGGGGVVEFNGKAQSDALDGIAEALITLAESIVLAGNRVSEANMHAAERISEAIRGET